LSDGFFAVRIGEENIRALRSFLLEGPDAWVPLQEEMQSNDESAAGYMSLLFGAFEVAARPTCRMTSRPH
jgi:hypothetical protein